MAAFTNLPTDIVRIILYCVLDHTVSNDKAVDAIIPLLSVCREWRTIAVPLLYNQAYFRSYIWHDFSSQPSHTYLEVQTNLDLILQNGYGDFVKNFVCSFYGQKYVVGGLMHMARVLGISVGNCSKLDTLMDYHGDKSNTPMDWDNENHIFAATTIATMLASKIPNTRRLDMEIDYSHGIITCFSSALVDCFADKLVEFNYKGPLNFPNKRPILGLKTVSLTLTDNDDSRIHPTICPQSIKKLTVVAKNILFDWNTFNTEQESNSVIFENLEYLHCKVINCTEDACGLNLDHRIQFPNIRKTVVQDISLSLENIEHQLRSGLRELHCIDELPMILELSQLDLSSLASLKLEFYGIGNENEEDEFIAHTNKLFIRLINMPIVYCTIYTGMDLLNPANIYWPNLTQLVIDGSVLNGNIFAAVLCMPDLIYLEIKHFYFDDDELECLLTYFKDLRTKHTNPSGSNITTLKIRNMKQIYYDQFMSSVQVLRWYWPKLATIDIRF